MIQPGTGYETAGQSMHFTPAEQDELFEQNIDDFDEQMDNGFDDGIAQSNIDDVYDEDSEDDEGDDDDDITPFSKDDEGTDYDELEDDD